MSLFADHIGEGRTRAATRRAAGAEPDRPHAPPGVRAPDPARPRRRDGGVGGAGRRDGRGLEFVFDRGLEHERKYLESLRADGKSVVEIETRLRRRGTASRGGRDRRGDAPRRRRRLPGHVLRRRLGRPGRLPAAGRPSRPLFGDWSYEIADTKLARKLKVAALLQMATYAERLTVLQGVAPESDPRRHRGRRRRGRGGWSTSPPTPAGRGPGWRPSSPTPPATEPVAGRLLRAVPLGRAVRRPSCGRPTTSAWSPACAATSGTRCGPSASRRWRSWPTATPELLKSSGIGADARTRLQQQAAEQLRERTTGRPSRTLLDPEPGLGLLRLPPPSAGDLYLDFEGDPWFERRRRASSTSPGSATGRRVHRAVGARPPTRRGRWSPT